MVTAGVQARLAPAQLLSAAFGDNAAAIQAAARLIASGENYGCAAHTVQLAVNDIVSSHFTALSIAIRVRLLTFSDLTCSLL